MRKYNSLPFHFPALQTCLFLLAFCFFGSTLFSQTTEIAKEEGKVEPSKSGAMTTDPLLHVNGGPVLFDGSVGDAPTMGSGGRMMWVPSKRAFRAGIVLGSQWDHDNIGTHSFVGGGIGNMASAEGSCVSGGDSNTAGGNRSFIGGGLGNSTTQAYTFVGGGTNNSASGLSSFVAGGSANQVSGNLAFTGGGVGLLAKSYAETVVGSYNTDYSPVGPNGFISTDRLFVIGKGSNAANRSNAMTVLKNGRIGIGTETPDATLQVTEGSVVFDGIFGNTPVSGAGTRMMWVPFKQAFRAGQVSGDHWDDANLGLLSFVAGGWNNMATGVRSGTFAGESSTASGSNAFVGGGLSNTASGDHAFAGGGTALLALSYGETVFGTYNTNYTPASTTSINSADRLFVIGNGTSSFIRSNAMTVMKNGTTGFARTPTTNRLEVNGNASKTVAGDWLANSDARLKKNIQSLSSTEMLQKVLALQGVTYEWSDDKTGYERPEGIFFGFTAQNIQEVFPNLVEEDGQGYLQTAYGTYDAILVEALRALHGELEAGKTRIEQLENENAALMARLENITAALAGAGILVER